MPFMLYYVPGGTHAPASPSECRVLSSWGSAARRSQTNRCIPGVVSSRSASGAQSGVTTSVARSGALVESSLVNFAYSPSKAAVNMLSTQQAKAYPEIRVNVVDPGYTETDFNDNRGHQTVEEGTDAIVAMATLGADGPTGTYTDRHGTIPW